jgi:hypothetical protein
MNCLRGGWSLPSFRKLWYALLEAPPGATVDEIARDILTPEQAAHPRFAELLEIFRQAEIEVAANARQFYGRWDTGTRKASATPSKAENLMKTKAGRKFQRPKAGNSLKTNTVSQFSPNIIENKGGYAPIWPPADAPASTSATASPDSGPPWGVAPPNPGGLLAFRSSPLRPMRRVAERRPTVFELGVSVTMLRKWMCQGASRIFM